MGRFRVKDVQRKGQCQVVALQHLGVLTDITIKPGVHCGEVEVTCSRPRILCDDDDFPKHRHKAKGKGCTVRVFQELCIRVPIFYEARADCDVRGVFCGPAVAAGDGSTGDDSSGDCWVDCSGSGTASGDCWESGTDASGDCCDGGADTSGHCSGSGAASGDWGASGTASGDCCHSGADTSGHCSGNGTVSGECCDGGADTSGDCGESSGE